MRCQHCLFLLHTCVTMRGTDFIHPLKITSGPVLSHMRICQCGVYVERLSSTTQRKQTLALVTVLQSQNVHPSLALTRPLSVLITAVQTDTHKPQRTHAAHALPNARLYGKMLSTAQRSKNKLRFLKQQVSEKNKNSFKANSYQERSLKIIITTTILASTQDNVLFIISMHCR